MPISQSLMLHYAIGKLGAFSFAGKFFLLFICGAVFGRVMTESRAVNNVALFFQRLLGKEKALWVIMLACALLTYGGIEHQAKIKHYFNFIFRQYFTLQIIISFFKKRMRLN